MSQVPRVPPVDPARMPDELISLFEGSTRSVSNSLRIMANHPPTVKGRIAMQRALAEDSTLDRELGELVFLMASIVGGCRHCQASATAGLVRRATVEEKIRGLWDFENSTVFTAGERAALALARDSAAVPNAVTDEHFVELRKHFTDQQIVEIVARSCSAAWVNRWTQTMNPPFDEGQLDAVTQVVSGWGAGNGE